MLPRPSQHEIELMVPRCQYIARRNQHRLIDPAVTTDDLAQVAMLGVLKAADTFDPARGVAWTTWATAKAEYEAMHFLRDHVPGFRWRGHGLVAGSIDAPSDTGEPFSAFLPDPTPEPDYLARAVLERAQRALTARQRALLTAHVVLGISQAEIAGEKGTKQVAVSREIRAALGVLARQPQLQALAA